MSDQGIIRPEGCFFEASFADLQARVGVEGGKIACGDCAQSCTVQGRDGAEGIQFTTDDAGKMLSSCVASFETRRKIHIARRLIANDGNGDMYIMTP